MPNAWLNHVRQFRKQNRHLSYKQLLNQAKNSYRGGGEGDPMKPMGENTMMQNRQQGGEESSPTDKSSMGAAMNMIRSMTQTKGGSANAVTGYESRSSLTRSATTLGGRRRSSRSRSRKTRRSRR